MLTWVSSIIGILAGGGGIAAIAKSFRWPRPYERVLVTGPRNLVLDKKTGGVREYTGFILRPVGFYRMTLVNIRDRMDLILLDGVMRPTLDPDNPARKDHREKWQLSATIKWHVKEGLVYNACEWQVDDVGEFARGKIQDAILNYLENTPVTMDLNSSAIFGACEETVREELLQHAVVWTDLMINKNALADAEIQGSAIRRIAKAIERWVNTLVRPQSSPSD